MGKKYLPCFLSHKRISMVILLLISGLSFSACDDNGSDDQVTLTGAYLGQTPPGLQAARFVPDSLTSNDNWWWHARVDLLNDGQEMYMDIYYETGGIRIRYMKMVDNVWTSHAPAPFANQNLTEASPSFINNGDKVFFISDRPNSSNYAIWSAERIGDSWAAPEPINIPDVPNLGGGWEISVTNDETIYARMENLSGSTHEDIYIIRKVEGAYLAPVRLDDNINSAYMDLGVFVDPDGEYLLFDSNRPGGFGETDIYISFKNNGGTWSPAQNLGSSVNSSHDDRAASVSSDKRYLFFSSDRGGDRNPYWIDAAVIENLRPSKSK
jgi:hypothetical protein